VLVRAVIVLVLAALAVPGAAQAENLTIQVTSVVIKITAIDKKPKGTSKGDRVTQRNKLINTVRQFGRPKGAQVGTDEGTVTFTSAHSERYEGVARLPGGTIKIKGAVKLILGGGIRIPVVGGTGRYSAATGMLYVAAGEERVLNVYRLTLAGNVA
jgi:Allene oxide cyclase barrel like domain